MSISVNVPGKCRVLICISQGENALKAGHLAAQYGHLEILEKMKNLEMRLAIEDADKHYPLYYATIHKKHKVFEFLLHENNQYKSQVRIVVGLAQLPIVLAHVNVSPFLFISIILALPYIHPVQATDKQILPKAVILQCVLPSSNLWGEF